MIVATQDRILVPLDGEPPAIPPVLFEHRGRVLLPAKWTEKAWLALDKKTKLWVYYALTDFPFWFRHVYLPHKSMNEGIAATPEQLDAIYPPSIGDNGKVELGLPEFMVHYTETLIEHCPLSLLPYERKPVHSDIWRICFVFPYGCFKSSMTCEAFPLYLIGGDPSVTIIITVESKEKGDRFIAAAKSHINTNKMYQWLYGDLHAKDSTALWRADSIEVDRPLQRSAPTMEVIGYRGAIQGERFDIGLGDDLDSPENTKTEDARAKKETWVDGPLSSRLPPDRRLLALIGTRQAHGDIYDRKKQAAKEKRTWHYEEQPIVESGTWPPVRIDPDEPFILENVCIPDDVVSIWPQWWTPKKLVEDWVDSPSAFAKGRMNQIRDPATKFFAVQILEEVKADGGPRLESGTGTPKPLLSRWPVPVGIPPVGSGLRRMYEDAGFDIDNFKRVIAVDLATTDETPGKDPDYTVFQLWGFDPNTLMRIVLNQLRKRTSDPKVIGNDLRDWVEAYQPDKLLIEANAVDKLFARSLQDIIGFPVIISLMQSQKVEMFEAFRDLVQNYLVWVPWANDNFQTRYVFASFIDEMYNYPEPGAHDDTLAAAVHAYTEMRSAAGGQLRATVLRPRSAQEIKQQLIAKEEQDGTEQLLQRATEILELAEPEEKDPNHPAVKYAERQAGRKRVHTTRI